MKFLPLLLFCTALDGATLSYWVEPCVHPESGCKRDDPELAQWAMEAWQAASRGALHLVKTRDREQALIRVHWVTGTDGSYGETRAIDVNGERGAEIYVFPTVKIKRAWPKACSHHGSAWPKRKNPPVGPSSRSRASSRPVFAPSGISIGARSKSMRRIQVG
jgi:hypothetical protein